MDSIALFDAAYAQINEGLSAARAAGVVCGPLLSLRVSPKEATMAKLTHDELVEMKAVGYIEGNSATIPDAIKVGQELHDKLVEHDTAFAEKQARKAKRDGKAE